MFNKIRPLIENNDLKAENRALYEENKSNREEIEDLELQKVHAKLLAQYTVTQLNKLEQIERSGNAEETKRKNRNVIYNDLRRQNINIIKELSTQFGKIDSSK